MTIIKKYIIKHFYGIMVSFSYLLSIFVPHHFNDREPFNQIKNPNRVITNIIYIYLFFARLFFCLFDSSHKFTLTSFVKIWNGGLSSFGGQFSVLSYMIYLSISHNIKLKYLFDICVLLVPIPGILIRLANNINDEIKPKYKIWLHISLIEMLLHGIIFGIIILYNYTFYYKPGIMFNLYTKYYITFRFFTEFLREKKKYYNLEYNGITIGIWQVCCLITINPYFLLLVIDQYTKKYNENIYLHYHVITKYTLIFFTVFSMFLINCINNYTLHLNNIYIIGLYGMIID